MKILFVDVKGKIVPEIHYVKDLKAFKSLLNRTKATLIETDYINPEADKSFKKFQRERLKGCEMIITLHNDYIE